MQNAAGLKAVSVSPFYIALAEKNPFYVLLSGFGFSLGLFVPNVNLLYLTTAWLF